MTAGKLTLVLFCFFFCQVALCQRYVTYIDDIESWWPPSAIAEAFGLPGYAADNE